MRPRLWTNVVSCFLAMAPAVWAQAAANTTSSSSVEVDTIVVTQVEQSVSTYRTELRAHLQGLPPLYDQSLTVPFGDPAFQSLISQARNILSAAGATSILNPTLLLGNSSQSSATNTVLTPGPTQIIPVVTTYIGPATPMVGNFGTCGGYTLGTGPQGSPQFTDCVGGTATTINVPAGSQDVDTLNIRVVTTNQTATTTFTSLTTQIWDMVGLTANTNTNNPLPPQAPVPPAMLLVLVGLACVGFFAAFRTWRAA
jgi:hypothetical protein